MARASKHRPEKTTVALVGDGQTERIYFADVRDTDRPANLSIFPDYPRKIGSYTGVLDRAMALAGSYDHIFALIDVDKILQDQQQQAYAKHKAAAEAAGIRVLENNPCFEMWLLLHFVHTGQLFDRCDQVSTQLRRIGRIPNYDKSEKFIKNARLYSIYKDRLIQQAIPHARLLEVDRAHKHPLYPRAETFRFFEWYLGQGL